MVTPGPAIKMAGAKGLASWPQKATAPAPHEEANGKHPTADRQEIPIGPSYKV